MIITKTVADRIKFVRKIRLLSQQEVADRAGINVALYKNYEYGKRNPRNEQLERLAAALKVPSCILRPRKFEKPEDILALVLDFVENFGDVDFCEKDGKTYLSVPTDTEACKTMVKALFLAKDIKRFCGKTLSKYEENLIGAASEVAFAETTSDKFECLTFKENVEYSGALFSLDQGLICSSYASDTLPNDMKKYSRIMSARDYEKFEREYPTGISRDFNKYLQERYPKIFKDSNK